MKMSSESSKKMQSVSTFTEGSVSVSDLDAATQRNLEAIDVCQAEIDNLNEKASEEILVIEQKYNELRAPHFKKRSEIIKSISNFWYTAIMNHPDLRSIVNDREEECLQFLNRIEVEEFEDVKSGYQIDFYFDENPFFENTVLTKEFHLEPVSSPKSQSSLIKWRDNNDLSKTSENKIGKTSRKRKSESKSFFQWFNDNVDPVNDDIAEVFKDDLWLNPLHFYLVPDIEEANGVETEEDSDLSEIEEQETEEQ